MLRLAKFASSRAFLFNSFRFNYMTSVYDSPELLKICQMISEPFHKYNEDIEHLEQIKLLDQNGKLIGNYTMKQAKKKAEKMKCDIVLINEAVSPPICKAFNYKDHLYKQFVKQIGHISAQRKSRKSTASKTIVVGTRITEHDMKNKIRMAAESSKKTPIIRVMVKLSPGVDEDDATNTLYAFRDLAAEHLVTVGDVTTGITKEEEEGKEGLKAEIEYLQLEFKNARAKVEQEEGRLSEKEIKKLVQSYFGRTTSGTKDGAIRPSKEADDMLPEEVKRMKKEQEAKERDEEESSDEGEEEKVVAFKKKTGQNKFTEQEIKKMEMTMKISAYERMVNLLTDEQKLDLAKLKKEMAEMDDGKQKEMEFNEENAEKVMKEANHTLKVIETQTRMTKRLLHLAKLYQK